jgi:uncharacterized protein (TIGR00369 family)
VSDTAAILARKDPTSCYVCGTDNALGLRVPFAPLGIDGSHAVYVARAEHAGWSDVLHGGVTFALMDEAFGWSLYFQNIPAVTAKVETRFHKPILVGMELTIVARVLQKRRTLYDVHAEIRTNDSDATLLAEADAVMVELRA